MGRPGIDSTKKGGVDEETEEKEVGVPGVSTLTRGGQDGWSLGPRRWTVGGE